MKFAKEIPMRFQATGPRIRNRRRGVTFTEVMFAVILLGIGFIMIAGLFPVSLQQSKINVEEAAAATVSRSAMNTLQQVALSASKYTFFSTSPTPYAPTPGPALVQGPSFVGGNGPLIESLSNRVKGNQIFADDPRYAWIPLYMRDGRSGYAQVFIWVVQARGRPYNATYTDPATGLKYNYPDTTHWNNASVDEPAASNFATLEPKKIDTTSSSGANLQLFHDTASGLDYARFRSSSPLASIVDSGSFILIGDDGNSGSPNHRSLNGRFFRLGNRRSELEPGGSGVQVWELAPGFGLHLDPTITPDGTDENMGLGSPPNPSPPNFVYVVGRQRKSPIHPEQTLTQNPFEGPTQDIALFTGMIRVN